MYGTWYFTPFVEHMCINCRGTRGAIVPIGAQPLVEAFARCPFPLAYVL